MNYKKQLQENSWVLIKKFFSQNYCDKLRNDCFKTYNDTNKNGEILSNPNLNHLLTNEKFIDLISSFFVSKPVYFGDSGFQIASYEGRISNGFHKDSVDRENPKGIDWNPGYSLIRVGIYLQDHENFSEGLVVREKSHLTNNLKIGKKINVPSTKGDVIVWYLTTTHSGNAKRIKAINFPVLMGDDTGGWLSHRLYYHLPKYFIQKSEKDRVAIFLTFGQDDIHLKRYINYLKYRRYMVDSWLNQNFDQKALELINKQNKLSVLDLKQEAKHIDLQNFDEYEFTNFKKYNI
jgi:hypothetical protein